MIAAWLIIAPLLAAESVASDSPMAPIEFVCDNLQLFKTPRRAICTENVVARRGDLIFCCDHFEGTMSADDQWERLVCTDNVRAQRGDEVMWSQRAELVIATADLILTGKPRIRRGQSLLAGARIVVNTRQDRAQIDQPRGELHPGAPPPARAAPIKGELPRRCPVAAAPVPR